MKRIIALVLVIVMSCSFLFSCEWINSIFGNENEGGGGGTGGSTTDAVTDVKIFGSGVDLALVRGGASAEYVGDGYSAIYAKLVDMGVDVRLSNDSVMKAEKEIAIGETTRQASKDAYAKMNEKHKEGNVTYAIVYNDGVLALAAIDEASFDVALSYFLENYLIKDRLVVKSDLSFVISMTPDEYDAYLEQKAREEQLASWESRFDYLEEYIGKDGVTQLKRLYGIFDERVYLWVANLWDGEIDDDPDTDIGGFYYAVSSRDHMGFLPDIESTAQALKILAGSGMLDSFGSGLESLEEAIPQQMQDKIVNFIYSLYCDDDGYFYHSQWGQKITDDRKGRDMTWSLQLLDYFNETLPDGWTDAITRLENKNNAKAAVSRMRASQVKPTASADGRFDSKENFIAYLDSLDILSNSYGNGHQIASQADQIKAAGLIDVACDYLDNLQHQIYEDQVSMGENPSGMWEPEVSYHSVSGFFKISVVYSAANRAQFYLSDVVDSCIKCILSTEDPEQIVYVYNPWAAIGEAISGMKRANSAAAKAGKENVYDINAEVQKIRDNAADMISMTADKVLEFRHSDGAFSYKLSGSAPTIQGVFASLGYAEGDMNATALVVYHMIGYMFGAFNLTKPDIWNINDYYKFMEEIDGLEPIEKAEGLKEINIDFESVAVDSLPDANDVIIDSSSTDVKVISDPTGADNKALSMESFANNADGFKVYTKATQMRSCFTFSADFYMASKSSGMTHQISFYNGQRNYMLVFKGGAASVEIGDASNVTGTNIINQSTGVSIPIGEWFNLKAEIYPDTAVGYRVKIYVNDTFVYQSGNFFGSEAEGAAPSEGIMSYVWFYTLKGAVTQLAVDNIHMAYEDKEFSLDDVASSDTEIYDFESTNLKFSAATKSTGSVAETVTATGIDNEDSNMLHFSKSATDTWDQLSFKMPTDIYDGSTVTVSMDIKFNSYSGGNIQLAMGELDSNAYYLLGFKSTGAGFSLYDSSSIHATQTAIDGTYELRKWYNLKIKFRVSESSSEFIAYVYIDGECVHTSKNYYNFSGESGAVPNISLDAINMRFVSATLADLNIDNVTIESK